MIFNRSRHQAGAVYITHSQIGLPEYRLYKSVKLVHCGIARLAELQHRGFAYLKIE
jgi:intracellular sulfur oxidation DsrE/DsrF family protein